jgi:hypothetical protein
MNDDAQRRAVCRVITVEAGDGCWSLAQRCGISQTQLNGYNPVSGFCNNLKVGLAWWAPQLLARTQC